MNDSKYCNIVSVPRQLTAAVKGKVSYSRMRQAHGDARAKLVAALPKLDAGPTGLFCTRTGMPEADGLYMEIGLIVARAFAPFGDVAPSELPAGRAAHYRLVGSFEGLPAAWPFLLTWCKEQGLKTAGINWEIYGEAASGPSQQVTDLFALLA